MITDVLKYTADRFVFPIADIKSPNDAKNK